MNQLSDLRMAVDATFSYILNEIQLSNLNFAIQITPYAAYITLKKSPLKYQDGSHALPSPPVLSLLQEAQHVIEFQKKEILELKASCEALTTKAENIVIENASLVDKVEKLNLALEASENENNTLNVKIETIEKELIKGHAENKILESKVKELKKKHNNEVIALKNELKSAEKSIKSREKENYNQKRIIESSRDSLKNLKSKISITNVCRTKLESENKILKKKLEKKENQHLNSKENAKSVPIVPTSASPPNTLLDTLIPTSSATTSVISSFPSMVSHWNFPYAETPKRPGSTLSMIAHCAKHPNPGSILISMEEVLQMMREMFEKPFFTVPLFGNKDDR